MGTLNVKPQAADNPDTKAEIERILAENAALKARAEAAEAQAAKSAGALTFKATDKGNLTVSGGKVGFPVTHSVSKWRRIMECRAEIEAACVAGLKSGALKAD